MSIARSIFGTFSANSLSFVLAFINSVLTIRILGVFGKGEISIINLSFGLFLLLLGLGLNSAIIYFVGQNKVSIPKVINTFFVFFVLLCVISFELIVLSFSLKNNSFIFPENYHHLSYVLIFIGFIFNALMVSVFKSIFLGLKKINFTNVVAMFSTFFTTCCLLVILFLKKKYFLEINAFHVFVGVNLVLIGQLIAYFIYLFKDKKVSFSDGFLSKPIIKSIIFFGGFSFFATLLQFFNYRLDFWFVEYYKGTAELGIYSLSSNLAQMVWLISKSISVVLFPYVASNSVSLEKLIFASKTLFFFLFLASLAVLPFMSFFIDLLYTQAFLSSVPIIKILLIGTIPFCMTNIYASYFAGKNLLKYNLIASFVGLLVTILLDIALIPKYGLVGSAVATTFSYLSTSILILIFFSSKEKIKFSKIIFYEKHELLKLRSIIYGKFRN